jgi:hypothetical protein
MSERKGEVALPLSSLPELLCRVGQFGQGFLTMFLKSSQSWVVVVADA